MERRTLTRLLVLASVLVVAFVATVTTLNLTVYSASGYVRSYLDAIARHDVDGALSMRGVTVPDGASRALLAPNALGELADIHLSRDTDDGHGHHTLVFAFTAGGKNGSTAFSIIRSGSRFGLFSDWGFAASPISRLRVTPLHDAGFTANGLQLESKGGASVAAEYAVLAPAAVALGHRSSYLTATTTTVLIDRAGGSAHAEVDVRANAEFTGSVQKQLKTFLDKCVTQHVLLPTGCPMGKSINDRIQDDPTWSMVRYPKITVVPAETPGSWAVPSTPATAHLTVRVKSIFDGSVSDFDQDVPFTVRYTITFQGGRDLRITAE